MHNNLLGAIGAYILLLNSLLTKTTSAIDDYHSNTTLSSYPLAVKSPYLSIWAPGAQLRLDAARSSGFTPTQPSRAIWTIMVLVDGVCYALFGMYQDVRGCNTAQTSGVSYSATNTRVNLFANNTLFQLDFLSPIFPKDDDDSYLENSMPYSYFTVTMNNTDKSPHKFQLLGAFDSWFPDKLVAPKLFTNNATGTTYWQFDGSAGSFQQKNDRINHGSITYGVQGHYTDTTHKVTSFCKSWTQIISKWIAQKGQLTTQKSTTCNVGGLGGLAVSVGSIPAGGSDSVTFTIGQSRDMTTKYLGTPYTSLFRGRYPTVDKAINYVIYRYQQALASSQGLDEMVYNKSIGVASTWGQQYSDIVLASVRQAFGAVELTVPYKNPNGQPYAFLKEISSNGNMNTVDLIFQSWPIYVNLNPNYIRLLLTPILDYLATGRWPRKWVIHDIGLHYPIATGHDYGNDESMPLFETSAMIIMMYAYQTFSGDTAFAQRYKTLLAQWGTWLLSNKGRTSLYPAWQLISVDSIQAQGNQTGLAVQSAIGLNALYKLTGNATYQAAASNMVTQLYDNGLGTDGDSPDDSSHFTYYYSKPESWNVLFAAYSDKMLWLDTFSDEAWEMQRDWYMKVMANTSMGLPFTSSDIIDNRKQPIEWGLTDWNFVTAAATFDPSAPLNDTFSAAIVNTTWTYMSQGSGTAYGGFGTKYRVLGDNAGQFISNLARSTVGSHFALMTMEDDPVWDLSSIP